MKKETGNRSIFLKVGAAALILGLIVAGFAAGLPVRAAASMEETAGTIQVFVGDTESAPKGYARQRLGYLEQLASANGEETVQAIIGFDDYYTLETVTGWLEAYDVQVNRVYMWPKGETGRLSLSVENGDIQAGIAAYCQAVESSGLREEDEEWKDYQRFLNGEFQVFALTVTASAGTLDTMTTALDCVAYADVMYHAEVEQYAASRGKDVYYIELPAKPDGAL